MHRPQRMARALWGAVIPFVLTSLMIGTARADVTLSVTPSLVELSATPGGQGSVDLQVTNNGSEAFDVTASVHQSEGGGGDLSAVDWLSLQPSEFHLIPGEHETVRVTVAVPSPLDSGGRYGTVMLKTGARAVPGAGIGVAGQVGVPFLIDVHGTGPLVRVADIDRLVPVLLSDGGVGFASSLVNRGNVHVIAAGSVGVQRLDGTPVGSLQLPETTPLLPRSTVVMKTLDSLPLNAGAPYVASASVDYGGSAPAVSDTRFAVRAGLAIGDMRVHESHDQGPTFRVAWNNEGSVGLLPLIQLEVRNSAGVSVGTAAPPEPPLLLPHHVTHISVLFPHELNKGTYSLVVRARYGAKAAVTREASFEIGQALPTPKGGYRGPAVPSASTTPWWMLGLVLPVGLLILGAGYVWMGRVIWSRRRRSPTGNR
jgi:hypothetical protein